MADTFSFDIVSEVNLQEVDNAVNQARKEIAQRYDFKGSKAPSISTRRRNSSTSPPTTTSGIKSVLDILQNEAHQAGCSGARRSTTAPWNRPRASTVRQMIRLRVGIDKDNARLLVKMIKDTKLKVQAQIMEDQVRVSGKDKDDLQAVMTLIREADLNFAVQFMNYR